MIFMVEISGKGGICHYTYNLCSELYKIENTILITSTNYELDRIKPIPFKIEKIFNRFRTNPLKIYKMIQMAKRERIRIVHFQLSQHPEFITVLILLFKMFTHAKIVVTTHNVLDHEERFYLRIFFKIIYHLCDIIIVHAKNNKDELLELVKIPEKKVKVIAHGNYLFFNSKNSLIEYKDNGRNKYVLFFGYIREYKGLTDLIQAMGIVRRDLKDAYLIIAGKPVEKFEKYKREIERNGLRDRVILDLRYVPFDKTEEYFKLANVVILPYREIYQSGVVQLAYAFGKPVIATNVGGLNEVICNGKTGFLVPRGSVEEMAKKIKILLLNETLQREMGENALHLARTKFSWENIVQQTSLVYNSIG